MAGGRRRYLAALAGALGTGLSGCTGLLNGGSGTTRTGEGTATGTRSESSTPGAVTRADGAWRTFGGTPAHAGTTVAPGPGASASVDWTANFGENRVRPGPEPPLVDDRGVHGISRFSSYGTDPPSFGLYAYSYATSEGSERWERELVLKEGTDDAKYVRDDAVGLGPDALYVWLVTTKQYEHELVSLSLSDGSVRWRTSLPELAGTPRALQPQVLGDTCYLYTGYRVHALSTSDGSVRWRSDEYLANSLAPAVTEDVVAFSTVSTEEGESPAVVALDATDGTERWRAEREHGVSTLPAVAGDTVYVTDVMYGGFGPVLSDVDGAYVYAFSLADGSERWRRDYVRDGMRRGTQSGGPPVVTVGEDRVYYAFSYFGPDDAASDTDVDEFYDGPNVVALDRTTGDLAWEAAPTEYGRFAVPPVLADGTLYCHHVEDGSVYALDAAGGTVKGSFGELRNDRAFAVVDDTVYERTDGGFRAWR